MSQQLAILLMIDVEAALKANTLKGNTYLIDNMKSHGSKGEGTGHLISIINGTYWFDGSQANEQVMNWWVYGIGALPRTLPRSFYQFKLIENSSDSLHSITAELNKIVDADGIKNITGISEKLSRITKTLPYPCKIKSIHGRIKDINIKIMNITGETISEDDMPGSSPIPPVITGISGEAVDKKVIFPAQYGSPDLNTDGWYWSATVDTNQTGTYAFNLHVTMFKYSKVAGEIIWMPVEMIYESYVHITNNAKRNGFTGGAVGVLPIYQPIG